MKKYKFKKISSLKKKKNPVLLNSAPDSKYLKEVERMLGRPVVPQKDTADYNASVISNFIDKTSIALRDAGQDKVVPGDALKIDEELDALVENRPVNKDLFDIKNPDNLNYEKFSFSDKLERELRTNFILKTKALDNFESLINELDGLMPRYMAVDDWLVIKMAISKGNERVAKNKLIFIEPEVFIGKEMRMSSAENKKFQIEANGVLKYDLRPDGPDLIALRDLVSMAKGEDVHPLAFGPGFFAKYLPELKENGIYGLIFQVKKNKLKEIKIYRLPKRTADKIKEYSSEYIQSYAPTDSIIMLTSVMKRDGVKKEEIFNDETRYFTVTPGRVSGPKDFSPFHYESMSVNEVEIMAGEVCLFENMDGKTINTRIYFVPESYDKLHPYHQHGSVVLGNNDQSYHSVAVTAPGGATSGPYQDHFARDVWAKDNSSLYQPSFLVAMYKDFKNQEFKVLLDRPNHNQFRVAAANLYEETTFLKYRVLELDYTSLDPSFFIYQNEEWLDFMRPYLEHTAPLHKRWLLGQYLKDGKGITVERQKGLIDKIAEDAKGLFVQKHFSYMLSEMKRRADKKKK